MAGHACFLATEQEKALAMERAEVQVKEQWKEGFADSFEKTRTYGKLVRDAYIGKLGEIVLCRAYDTDLKYVGGKQGEHDAKRFNCKTEKWETVEIKTRTTYLANYDVANSVLADHTILCRYMEHGNCEAICKLDEYKKGFVERMNRTISVPRERWDACDTFWESASTSLCLPP